MRNRVLAILIVALAPVHSAFAQGPRMTYDVDVPRGDITAGFAVSSDSVAGNRIDGAAFTLSAGRNVITWLGIAGEAAFYQRETYTGPHGRAEWNHSATTLLAGPRVATPFINDS